LVIANLASAAPFWFNRAPLIALYVPQAPTAHRCDGFVECRENPPLPDGRCDVVSVHVGPKVRTDTCENNADALTRQIFEQIP
jgi:hypothetical protein